MIETDIVVGAELRITCSKDELVQSLGVVGPGRLDPHVGADPVRDPARGERQRAAAGRDRHGAVAARVATGTGAGRRGDRPSRPHARRHRAAAAGRRGDDRAPGGGVGRPRHVGKRELHAAHVQPRGLPAAARARRGGDVRRRSRAAARDDHACCPGCVARRVAAGADRRARPVHRRPARDGGDGLLPAGGQADVAGGAVPELEAIVPGRALQELARIASAGETVGVGVHENQVLFSTDGIWLTTRRIDGQFPNYRQLLPEAFEYELRIPRSRPARRRPPGLGDDPARDAAPAALRRGRADGDRPHARGRRVDGVAAGRVHRRDARDRLQRRLPARGARVARPATRSGSS